MGGAVEDDLDDMRTQTPLGRLREIRELQQQAKELNEERDGLIREAVRCNSERAVALASGLSQVRVHEVVKR